jgi:DNA-binding GntR family transcriptional regulator
MYEAGGVPDLWELVGRVSGHVDRLRRLHLPTAGKTEAILRDHRAIVRAIARHDGAAAQKALREHLSGTLSSLPEICARHPDFIAGRS